MRDIGLAGLALLSLVRFLGEVISIEDLRYLVIRQVALQLLDEAVQSYRALPVWQAGQYGSGVIHGRCGDCGSVSQRGYGSRRDFFRTEFIFGQGGILDV